MRFSYVAKTKDGRIQKGFINFDSREEAFNALSKYDLIPLSLTPKKEELFSFKKKISLKDLVFFTRQMSTMLKSSLSILETLRTQIIETNNPYFREKLFNIAQIVESGGTFSQAISLYPDVFNQFYLNMIRSAEATGKLSDVLGYLANYLEKNYKLQAKIKSAMVYPAFIILVLIAAIFLMTFFVLPQLTPVFETFGENLPLITKVVLKFTDFFRKEGWIIFLILILGLALAYFILRKKNISANRFERLIFKIPIINDFYKKFQVASICGNVSALLGAGLPIVQAFKIAGDILQSPTYKQIISEAQKEIARGETISSVFSKYPTFIPSFVIQMTSVGEKSGNIEELLSQTSTFFQDEIDRFVENLPSLIEPALLVILGIGIGILVIAIYIPILQVGFSSFQGM
jgi:type IV pilus assembly protein PilC